MSRTLHHQGSARGQNPRPGQRPQHCGKLAARVGGIEQHQVEVLPGQPGKGTARLAPDHAGAVLEAQLAQVAAQRRHGSSRAIDEDGPLRPPRQGLDPERSAAGVEVEYGEPLNRTQTPIQRLAYTVGGRSDTTARHAQTPARESTSRYPHLRRTPRPRGRSDNLRDRAISP